MTVMREVLEVEGHRRPGSPVPELTIVGDLLYTSLCGPTSNARPTKVGEGTLDEDAEWLFRRIRRNVEAAGGTVDHIIDFAIYLNRDDTDGSLTSAIRRQWQAMFQDPGNRPACRILNVYPEGVHRHWPMAATAMAVLPGRAASGGAKGRLLYSPTFTGRDPATGDLSTSPFEQSTTMFDQIRGWVEAHGGTLDNILDVSGLLHSESCRKAFDQPWARLWPDVMNLPARQTYVRPQALHAGEFFSVVAMAVL